MERDIGNRTLGQAPNGEFTVQCSCWQDHGIAWHGTTMGTWHRSSLYWWLESTRFKMHLVRQGQGWQSMVWKGSGTEADRPLPNEIPQEEAIQQVVVSGQEFNLWRDCRC
jgi:hypothetical protein